MISVFDGIMGNIFSAAFGALVTILVAWAFYRKSEKTKLYFGTIKSTIFLSEDSVDLKNSLEILYQEQKVNNIAKTSFIVANVGNRAIRPTDGRFTIRLPIFSKILEAKITYTARGRNISVESIDIENNEVKILSSVLNKSEFFFITVITEEKIEMDNTTLSVNAENVEPHISPASESSQTIIIDDEDQFYKKISRKIPLVLGSIMTIFPFIMIFSFNSFFEIKEYLKYLPYSLIKSHKSNIIGGDTDAVFVLAQGLLLLFMYYFLFIKKRSFRTPTKIQNL